ncbi:MAG TPA: hypothetical protein VJR24_13025 [Gemmatimonadaceae bacterium]|nr:hypothetical protein [Gemmatimonadaceae bacterium]
MRMLRARLLTERYAVCALRYVILAVAVAAVPAAGAQSSAEFASGPAGVTSRPDTQIIVAHRLAPNRDVRVHYDKSRDLTTIEVKPFNPGGGLDLRIAASFIGHTPNDRPVSVRFVFASSSFRWIYGDHWDLRLALPDATILHYTGERLWKVGSESHFDQGISQIAIERMTFDIPLADVQRLIQAGSAVGMLGPTEIELTPRRVAAIADFVNRITPR